VRNGSYETVLLKPMDPLTFMVATNFSPHGFGNVLCGLALLIYAAGRVDIAGMGAAAACLLLFVAGFAVTAGVQFIMAALSFKWVGNSRLHEMFSSVESFGQYPITIFPQTVRAVVTFIVPVGLMGFYPAAALLGRIGAEGYAAALNAFIFLAFGLWLYAFMVRQYKGAGG